MNSRELDRSPSTLNFGRAAVSRTLAERGSAHRKGDLSPRTSTPAPWSVWALEVEDSEVEPAAKRLLELLEDKREAIANVVREMGAIASVRIWWEPEEGYGGYCLSSATVRAM